MISRFAKRNNKEHEMKQFKCSVLICCCMVLGGITGCGLLDRSSPEASDQNATSAKKVKGEVITEDDAIQIRDKGEVDAEEAEGVADRANKMAACTYEAAQAVARAYLLSMPVKDETISLSVTEESPLSKFVAENKALFVKDGPAIRCITALGEQITALGEQSYDSSNSMHRAIMSKWGGKSPEAAANAADTVQSHGASMYQMGVEMRWLSNVLPSIVDGNYDAFNRADSPLRHHLDNIRQKNDVSDAAVRPAITTEMEDVLNDTLNQYGPALEDEIVTLAGTLPAMRAESADE
jgi:hypothetical protein